jgi:hypothetical protein
VVQCVVPIGQHQCREWKTLRQGLEHRFLNGLSWLDHEHKEDSARVRSKSHRTQNKAPRFWLFDSCPKLSFEGAPFQSFDRHSTGSFSLSSLGSSIGSLEN